MKQGNIRVHSKNNIFEVKCREEEGKLFGVTERMQSILWLCRAVKCKFIVKEGPVQTFSKVSVSLSLHATSE